MPAIQMVTLNAVSGAFITINATIPSRYVMMVEDEAAPAQGLVFQSLTDGFVKTRTVSPGSEPVILGDAESRGGGIGPILADPGNTKTGGPVSGDPGFRAAQPYFKVKSATATVTVVAVTEYE